MTIYYDWNDLDSLLQSKPELRPELDRWCREQYKRSHFVKKWFITAPPQPNEPHYAHIRWIRENHIADSNTVFIDLELVMLEQSSKRRERR